MGGMRVGRWFCRSWWSQWGMGSCASKAGAFEWSRARCVAARFPFLVFRDRFLSSSNLRCPLPHPARHPGVHATARTTNPAPTMHAGNRAPPTHISPSASQSIHIHSLTLSHPKAPPPLTSALVAPHTNTFHSFACSARNFCTHNGGIW